jgi:hypothetical protein
VKHLLALLAKLTHLGVDPSRPRHETKHIVLTNTFALVFAAVHLFVLLSPTSRALAFSAIALNVVGAIGMPLVLVLNARRLPTAASAWLTLLSICVFYFIGRHEPEESEIVMAFSVNAMAAWFVFPSRSRDMSILMTVIAIGAMVLLTFQLRADPPMPPRGYDVAFYGFGNRVLVYLIIVAISIYAAREVTRVERELVAEREKNDRRLRAEVSHQVAERSRELGEALSRIEVPVAAPLLAAGDRFESRYRVHAPIGEGGMGAVYEVERLTDGERLALKLVSGQTTGASASRFAREAEIGARVRHENLVSIVDVGIASGGAPYLVMELVRGSSLEGERERFGDVAWGLPILGQVAAGLGALHAAGVVHRDLKPGNVLVSGKHAKISDFGISRFRPLNVGLIDVDAATLEPTKKPKALTGTGAFLGTPLYMAPEAAKGSAVDAAADMFAFGIVAYEVLTGRAPFPMPPILVAMAGLTLPQPSMDGIPEPVAKWICDCLAVDPKQRPSAGAVRSRFT